MIANLFYTIWLGATNWEFKGTKRGVYSKETGSLLRPKWGLDGLIRVICTCLNIKWLGWGFLAAKGCLGFEFCGHYGVG